MTATIPYGEPTILTAGDTWKWHRSGGDYPASDGWQLSYEIRGKQKLTLAWAAEVTQHATNLSDFSVVVAATKTQGLSSGQYKWDAYATNGSERVTLGSGVLIVRPNLAVAPPGAERTHAEKMLECIEAVLEGRITTDIESYTILGRSVTRIPADELQKWRAFYTNEVNRERNQGRLTIPVEAVMRPVN